MMICKLTAKNNEQVMEYLQLKPSFSLFLVADIEKYGYESDVFTVWGAFEQRELQYVFGKYYNTLIIYSNIDELPVKEICHYLNSHGLNYNTLIGRRVLAEQFLQQVSFSKVYRNFFCELRPENFTPRINQQLTVTKAQLSQTTDILKLLSSIEEFSRLDFHQDALKAHIKDGGVYLIMEQGEIASLAMCSANTRKLANIGGVCTAKPYRKQGYASTVVSTISQDYLRQGLICCLGYNNPAAGSIYKKIGYQEVGQVIIARK